MKQDELVNCFLRGEQTGDASNLHIIGNQLVHYETPIAERFQDAVILNYTRYSVATGKIQKTIRAKVPKEKLLILKKVEPEAKSLKDYLTDFEPKRNGAKLECANSNAEAVIKETTSASVDANALRIVHKSFGEGFVLSIEDDRMLVSFDGETKTLLYPMVFDLGIVTYAESK